MKSDESDIVVGCKSGALRHISRAAPISVPRPHLCCRWAYPYLVLLYGAFQTDDGKLAIFDDIPHYFPQYATGILHLRYERRDGGRELANRGCDSNFIALSPFKTSLRGRTMPLRSSLMVSGSLLPFSALLTRFITS